MINVTDDSLARGIKQVERARIPVVTYYPKVLQLYITDKCNFQCVFCVARQGEYRFGSAPAYQEMAAEILDKISDAIEHADHVYLTGGGEPLMSPLFWDFVEGRRPVKGIYFNTNGSLLHEKNIERLMSYTGHMNLGISMNACTRETYRRLMGVDLFDRVRGNIANLVNRKRCLGKEMQIDLSMVVVKENIDEMIQLCDLASELGADRVVAHIGEFSQEYVRGDFSVCKQSLRHNPELTDVFEKNLLLMDQKSKELGLLSWSRDGSDALWDVTCNDIFDYMGITAEGDTFSCCKGCAVPTGSINEYNSFMELWNNEKRQGMRHKIINSEFPRECRKPICPYWRVQQRKAITVNEEGETLFNNGDVDSAATLFRKSISMNPHLAAPHNNLGVLCWNKGDYQAALKHFLDAYKLDRYDRDTCINLINILIALEEVSDAGEILAAYLNKHPDDEEMNLIALNILNKEKSRV